MIRIFSRSLLVGILVAALLSAPALAATVIQPPIGGLPDLPISGPIDKKPDPPQAPDQPKKESSGSPRIDEGALAKRIADQVTEDLAKRQPGIADRWGLDHLAGGLGMVSGAFRTVYMFTPLQAEVDWARRGWNNLFWLAILVMIAAFTYHSWRLISPPPGAAPPLDRLKALGLAAILMVLSMYAVDFATLMQNTLWRRVLEAIGEPGWTVAAFFKAFLGVGTIQSATAAVISFLFTAINLVLLIVQGIVTIVRYILLRLVGIASPVYFAVTGFAMYPGPAVTWGWIMLLNVLVQSVFALTWWAAASVQKGIIFGEIGIPAAPIITVILCTTLYLEWRYWLLPTLRALIHPLSGGMKAVGAAAGKFGTLLTLLGVMTGQPKLAMAGQKVRAASDRIKERQRQLEEIKQLGLQATGTVEGRGKEPASQADGVPYWRDGGEYLYYDRGLLVRSAHPPEGGKDQGPWKGGS